MPEVSATRGSEKRTFSEEQWKNIGPNPANNGGWRVKAPKEAKAKKEKEEKQPEE